jgi:hypothetical protein
MGVNDLDELVQSDVPQVPRLKKNRFQPTKEALAGSIVWRTTFWAFE